MPKKPPKGAFWFFLLDYKKRCERNGEQFPDGVRDESLKELAGAEWAALPKDLRKPFEDRAKQEKSEAKLDNSRKETNMHRTFGSIDRQKLQEEEAKNQMNQWIENKVQSLQNKRYLAEQKFYLIHVNYFCISENVCYHPAELAVAEFSLGEGVTNVYHTIINPGRMPLGYRFDAIQKSEATHKIPLDENPGERNFYNIFTDIKRFLEPGRSDNHGDYPPMFTMEDNVNLNTSISCVKDVMKTLCDSMPNEDPDRYPVYSLEKLFFELRNAVARVDGKGEEEFPAISFARAQLEQDMFNYTLEIACKFHINEDVVEYCSRSYVQRWVYLICDFCSQYLNIQLMKGKHLPLNADTNFRREVREQEQKKTEPKSFTMVDHSKKSTQTYNYVEVEKPIPQRSGTANFPSLGGYSRQQSQEVLEKSEENFPSIPIGRGRGRVPSRGRGQEPQAFSFASVLKK